MRNLSDLPEDLRAVLDGHDVIVFDGVCVLCSGFFRFVLRHDTERRFRFVLAQSDIGHALYSALDLPAEDFETNLVVVDGVVFERMDAFAAAMRAMRGPVRGLSMARFIPEPLKSALYHRIARNRYRIFGRTESCLIPDADLRSRFLPGGMV